MSRKIDLLLVLISIFVLTFLSVNCEKSTDVKPREAQTTGVGENLIVSIINNVIKLKDNSFFRSGIESSVRSVFSKPITSAVYALSVIAGVVAMLAFYESPVSPMPVPPLPDPPVGRFPPEHPIWPPPHKEPINVSDKKRVGMINSYQTANSQLSPQIMFPQMNSNQKYPEMDPSSYAGAYQQLLNVLENRNSKAGIKINRINSNSLADSTPQVYSSFNVEPDSKLMNDSIRLQSVYSEANPSDRLDSVDTINKHYNQNQNNLNKQFDKIKEYTNLKKSSVPEVVKEKERFNYTSVISGETNANRRPARP